MSILTCAAVREQAPVVEVAKATRFSSITAITPASGGRIVLTLTNSQGIEIEAHVLPGNIGSYTSLQRALLLLGVRFVNSTFERGRRRFHAWRRELDQLLRAAGNQGNAA